jgi:hypothetical protein
MYADVSARSKGSRGTQDGNTRPSKGNAGPSNGNAGPSNGNTELFNGNAGPSNGNAVTDLDNMKELIHQDDRRAFNKKFDKYEWQREAEFNANLKDCATIFNIEDVWNGAVDGLAVKQTKKGKSLIATKKFEQGDVLGIYAGYWRAKQPKPPEKAPLHTIEVDNGFAYEIYPNDPTDTFYKMAMANEPGPGEKQNAQFKERLNATQFYMFVQAIQDIQEDEEIFVCYGSNDYPRNYKTSCTGQRPPALPKGKIQEFEREWKHKMRAWRTCVRMPNHKIVSYGHYIQRRH